MSFDQLGLAPEFLRAVSDQGYTEPTPVQAEAIPLVLAGRDLMAGAQTGTGKTAAFVMPMLQRLGRPTTDPRARRPIRTLVLAPTRELALQVEESVRTYGHHWGVRSAAIYGGVGFAPQVRALRNGPDVVVATPGRLLDHIGQRTIDLSQVEILVLDEADRMLDMGFIRDIRRVLDVLPKRRQNLLFSATFSDEIRALASGFLHDPATVQVTPRNSATPLVSQVVHLVDRERKRELLSHLIRTGVIDQALVFARTKHGANRLAEQLARDGIAAVAIHGNKSQGQRVRALDDFKAGRATILVATEIAARGLDIDGLPHVVNFELPMVPEDYVHRIGRTGRAGMVGHAVSLVCVDEGKLLGEIERILGTRIPTEIVTGYEPDRSIRAEPILRGGLGRTRPGQASRPGQPSGAGRSGRATGGWSGQPGRAPSGGGGYAPARRPAPAPQVGHRGGPVSRSGPVRPGQGIGQAQPAMDRSGGPFRPSGGPRPGNDQRLGNGQRPNGPRPGNGPRPSGGSRPSVSRPSGPTFARPQGGHQAMPGERLARAAERPR